MRDFSMTDDQKVELLTRLDNCGFNIKRNSIHLANALFGAKIAADILSRSEGETHNVEGTG